MKELEIVQYRQIKGLTVFFSTVDYRTPHFHPEWEILWLLDHSLSVTRQQDTFLLHPGELILFSPNQSHEFHKIDGSATFLCIQISPDILPPLPPQRVDGQKISSCFSQPELQELKQTICRIFRNYLSPRDNYELRCIGESDLLLDRLLSRLPRYVLSPDEAVSLEKKNARLDRLIRFVDENYMHKIRLSDFARAEGCSMSYLSHFVKETLNQSFQDYVASVRFNNACRLIASGGMKMLDVCLESGFSDYRYFSRAFQQQYGMTPEQYSQSRRKVLPETPSVRHSLHSIERFYSREESLKLMEVYLTPGLSRPAPSENYGNLLQNS